VLVVLVRARLPKDTKYVAPAEDATVASKLIDKTNPPTDDE
jgi:hypothetical protein